ncbi:hypothetical protein L3X38_033560 [Prunus dulcis]|uniref:Uncharacterized protein n=1 Tax=Prunus dulcis TaxID=3755 RepID=A0AAD4YW15_PRUDU|nr:hypothetical protein L3X38_033560 [Prunus dulcis]
MDKSWVHLHRSTQEYKDKMELFLNEALSKSARKDKIICPFDEKGSMDPTDSGGEACQMYNFLNDRFLQPLIEENVGSSRHKPILRVEPSRLNGFISCLRTLIRSCTLDVRSIKNWKPL